MIFKKFKKNLYIPDGLTMKILGVGRGGSHSENNLIMDLVMLTEDMRQPDLNPYPQDPS